MHRLIRQSHWFILVLGAAITVWAAIYVAAQIERKAQDSFVLRVQDMEAAIVRRLRSYEDILFGVAGLYQASEHVTPEQFDLYGDSLNIKERFPALQTINFAQYVTRDEFAEFTREYHKDALVTGGKVPLDLPADRKEYMVLTRAYPATMVPTLGTDVFQNRVRRISNSGASTVILRSEEYVPNNVISSGIPITPAGMSFSALAARLSIFKTDKNNTPWFLGTAGIGFDIAAFFREAVPEKLVKTIHYKMVNLGRLNGTRYNPPVPVFDSRTIRTGIDPDHFSRKELLRKHFDIPFGGALFRIEVSEHRDVSIDHYERFLPATILAGGFLFFGGISMASRRMLSDNAALDAAVSKRTIELQCEINRTKSLERELAVVIDSERIRIGRELHDDLGQRLTGISVSAEILASELLAIDPKLATKADDLGRATSDAMMQVRTLAHGLMPVASGPEGLRDALTHLAASISRLSGINCTFDFDDPVDITDENVSAHLYRIAQEAVNNAIRHAHARSIDIRLDERNGKASLSISDDGRGFDNTSPGFRSGMGLNTITYRASIINYDLDIRSSIGGGTVIRVTET
jgi:signal transduction histidine kinase